MKVGVIKHVGFGEQVGVLRVLCARGKEGEKDNLLLNVCIYRICA